MLGRGFFDCYLMFAVSKGETVSHFFLKEKLHTQKTAPAAKSNTLSPAGAGTYKLKRVGYSATGATTAAESAGASTPEISRMTSATPGPVYSKPKMAKKFRK